MGVFSNILGIPLGGNASPFIADLYLSWCEYCYMTKIVKTDYAMAKLLSHICRYLDDICTVNFKYIGDIANYIYMAAHCCPKVVYAVTHRTPSWIFISVLLTAILSNIHSMLGYTTFYSQLIRFFRLCNNINDFLFRAKLSYSKLFKRGYIHSLLFKYFKRFCLAYQIEENFCEKDYKLFLSCMIKYSLCFLWYK